MFDWKIAIFSLQFVSTIVTISVFLIIKLNDIKHLSIDVKEISKNIGKIFTKLEKVEKDIVKRDAVCEMNHPKK